MNNETANRAEEYDLIVLGSGEGGKYLAWTVAKQGKRVALVERKVYRWFVSEYRLPSS